MTPGDDVDAQQHPVDVRMPASRAASRVVADGVQCRPQAVLRSAKPTTTYSAAS